MNLNRKQWHPPRGNSVDHHISNFDPSFEAQNFEQCQDGVSHRVEVKIARIRPDAWDKDFPPLRMFVVQVQFSRNQDSLPERSSAVFAPFYCEIVAFP